jgi:hypothetical protein
LSTDIHGGFSQGSGTSYASPIMASAFTYLLGVLLARAGDGADVFSVQNKALEIMCSTAVKQPSLPSVCGRVSLDSAVYKALHQ